MRHIHCALALAALLMVPGFAGVASAEETAALDDVAAAPAAADSEAPPEEIAGPPLPPDPNGLKAVAKRTGVLGRMMEVTKIAGLDDTGVDVGPLTLFAPSDAAFEALPQDFRDKLLAPENREHLVRLLLHHAIPGEFPTERLLKARVKHYAVDAIDGSEVEITTRRGIDVEGAKIVQADVMASDGIIHIIDKVLVPRSVMIALSDDPRNKTTVAAHGNE